MGNNIRQLWNKLYGTAFGDKLDELLGFLDDEKKKYEQSRETNPLWYKDAVIFSLYVDAFAGDFTGLENKLPYLQELGVNTLWLLPILDSPMKDQGFDIRDFYTVREDLGKTEDFFSFIDKAHKAGIRILFDVTVNHTSDRHPWFLDSASGKESKYRNYYHWNSDDRKYSQARLLFKGMVPSNWEYNEKTGDYFFHRFYAFQPDLNYSNPDVMIDIVKMLSFWKSKGVDGLRMDACPFIWKEEGTDCEDLENTHTVLKMFRACLDYIQTGTMLIAEANMPPMDVAKYFGNDDECQTAYHFQLMAKFYLAVAESDYRHITKALSPEITPDKPENCQWISFLRCHDELTLEFTTREDRDKMNSYYLKERRFTFREGEGISGRLYNLMDKNAPKVLCINSLLFSTTGSPVIYHGDEVAMENDEDFYELMVKKTGFNDTRFFNRGPMDWNKALKAQETPSSDEAVIFRGLKKLIEIRKKYAPFFHKDGTIIEQEDKTLYRIERSYNGKKLVIIHNLSNKEKNLDASITGTNVIDDKEITGNIFLKPYDISWILTK